nr:AEC family transporter [Candidatus Sigynarchaeota archaeon]
MTDLNTTFLVSLAIIVLGYLLKRSNVISQEHGGKAMARVIFYVTLPGVILRALTSVALDVTMAFMPVFAPIMTAVVIIIAFLMHRSEKKQDRGLYIMMSLGFNVGNFGFPLIQGIFGDEGIKYAAMFDVGNALMIFCVCYVLAVYHSPLEGEHVKGKMIVRKVLTSPPFLAYFIALALNVLGIGLPFIVKDVVEVIAMANHFLTFLVLGVYLNFNIEKHQWIRILKVLATRYSIGILLGVIFFVFLPVDVLARSILLICYILPVGMALLVYVVQYGYNENFAGMLSNLNIVISF